MATNTADAQTDDDFVSTYGKSIGVIFLALIVTHLPLINLVNIVPFLKEAVIAVGVVVGLTAISDTVDAAKHAVIAGMIAAVAFNIVWIPVTIALGSAFGAAPAGDVGGLSTSALAGIGALINLIGVVIFSPIGYAVGGAIGSYLN